MFILLHILSRADHRVTLLCSALTVMTVTASLAENVTVSPASVQGWVRDSRTGTPLEGVNVMVAGSSMGTATDPQGYFHIDLFPDEYRLRFRRVGYIDQVTDAFRLIPGQQLSIEIRLVEGAVPMGEVLVVAERKHSLEQQLTSTHFLERRQIEEVSGSAEDVLRTVQTLPGVVAPADFFGRVYVRGGKASENIVVLDRVFIYEPYHLGGVVSIFNPELIDHVEFYAGGYPAKYGMGLASILRVVNKTGMGRSLRGDVSLSMLSANAILQGQLPGQRGSWIFSARRTYHDKLMEAVGAFENHVFPHFHDVQLKTIYPLGQSHIFTFDFLSSGDAMKIKMENPDDRADAVADSGDLAWDNQLTLTSLDWKWILTPRAFSHLTAAYSRQPFQSEISGVQPQWLKGKVVNFDLNGDVTLLSFKGHEIETGVYARGSDVDLNINFKQDYFLHSTENSNVALDTTLLKTSLDKLFWYIGVYLQDRWQVVPPVLDIDYGLRYEMMNTSPIRPVSPRFSLGHQVTDRTRLKFSWGYYYQYSIDPVQLEPPLGSNDLRPKRAVHYILGLEHELTTSSRVRLEAYVKELTDLFVIGPEMKFTNYGRGSVRGVEFFYERSPSNRLSGWASYAYSAARRKDQLRTSEYYPLQDQRHTFSVVMNYRFDRRWKFSLKWALHSGRPYTPVLGAEPLVDDETGEVTGYFPLEGDINSERFPGYQRLDVRLDRLFRFQGWNLSVYLEVLNLYYHKNVYDYSYTKDYSRRITTYQFPLLPAIGAKVSF
jgi:hypothetical protein